MSNYSYSEIQNMQQKAMARVRQMQKNTDAVLEKAQQDFEIEKPKPKTYYETTPVAPKIAIFGFLINYSLSFSIAPSP